MIQEKLKKIADHISYEIEMFELSADKLRKGGLNQLEVNAFLEVFAIHARNIIDFLYPPKNPRSDDVIADQFFLDLKELRDLLPEITYRELIKNRVGKEIAHLTYKRLEVTPELKIWQTQKIQMDLNQALSIFFKLLPDEQRGWFRVIIRAN